MRHNFLSCIQSTPTVHNQTYTITRTLQEVEISKGPPEHLVTVSDRIKPNENERIRFPFTYMRLKRLPRSRRSRGGMGAPLKILIA